MAKGVAPRDGDDSLAVRAAWLHYMAGLTQAEVAARLGVSTVKAHRLVTLANQNGAVRVSVVGDIVECLELETRLSELYGLAECTVVPDLDESPLPLKALGAQGAAFLEKEIGRGAVGLIGFGLGRTLAAAVGAMTPAPVGKVRFVSLMGALTRHYVANPYDVMHELAQKTAAEAYVMPVPFFANSGQDREILLAQRGVREVFELGRQADLVFVGVGTVQPDAQLVASRMIESAEIAEIRSKGGVGEMLGHFFDSDGRPVETSLSARTISPDLASLAGRRVIGISGGDSKAGAIRAVLRSGCLTGLITDERTARGLAGDEIV